MGWRSVYTSGQGGHDANSRCFRKWTRPSGYGTGPQAWPGPGQYHGGELHGCGARPKASRPSQGACAECEALCPASRSERTADKLHRRRVAVCCRELGVTIEVFGASNNREIDAILVDLVNKGSDALVVGSSVLFTSRRVQLVTLAAVHRVPAIYYDRTAAEIGGLMSYGARATDAMRQGGVYVGRVLKGEKPADLPVMQSLKFEFILNLQTARAMKIAVPASLLAQADEVIE